MVALKHAGLVCATEENADRFYQELLGLIKNSPSILPRSLSKAIFGIDSDLTMINYMKEGLHFEIFIQDQKKKNSGTIEHLCIEVENRQEFIDRCRSMGVTLNQIQKGEKKLVFITDFDGNLFEVK